MCSHGNGGIGLGRLRLCSIGIIASLKQTSGHKSNIITDTSIIYFQNCIPHCKKYAGALSKTLIISAELLDPFSQTISIKKTHHLLISDTLTVLPFSTLQFKNKP
jgi:hypothetical protein